MAANQYCYGGNGEQYLEETILSILDQDFQISNTCWWMTAQPTARARSFRLAAQPVGQRRRVCRRFRKGPASGFELWVRFFRHAWIYSADVLIGGFRSNRDSRTMKDPEACYRMHDSIVNEELDRVRWGKPLKLVGAITRALKPIPIVRGVWRLLVTENLYHRRGRDCAPVIEFWDELRFRRE
jgi:hypothetical protein